MATLTEILNSESSNSSGVPNGSVQLLLSVLWKKAFSLPMPLNCDIAESEHVFHSNPWELPGNYMNEKRYFFCRRDIMMINRNLSCGCGYWKPTSDEVENLYVPGTNNQFLFGVKKSLEFYKLVPHETNNTQRESHDVKSTGWNMELFCLVSTAVSPDFGNQRFMTQLGTWAVCCLYKKNTEEEDSNDEFFRLLKRTLQEPLNKKRKRYLEPLPPCASGSVGYSFF